MASFTVADLAAAGALSVALFSALLLLAILSRAREDLLLSRTGWHLVAAGMGLLALRSLELLVTTSWVALAAPLAGIGAAILLPTGLYLVLRAAQRPEVSPGEPGR